MILGIGIDLVDMRRIETLLKNFGDRFTHKVFTEEECAYALSSLNPARAFANRFAGKEALAKALGTGMGGGIGWQDIEVVRAPSGAPLLRLHNKAHETLLSLVPSGHVASLHVSFSDEPPYSTAFVVISADSTSKA